MKKIILWSLFLGVFVNISDAPVYSSDEVKSTQDLEEKEKKGSEESKAENSDKKADKTEKSSAESKDANKSEDKEKVKKKKKTEKPDNIKVSDECWDAMVEAKGDESGRACKKLLNPLRKKKTEDGEKAPCSGKENKKGFKAAVKELCKEEKDE